MHKNPVPIMHEMDVELNERGFGILPEFEFIRFHMLLLVAVSRFESIQISGRDSTSSILMKIELPRANEQQTPCGTLSKIQPFAPNPQRRASSAPSASKPNARIFSLPLNKYPKTYTKTKIESKLNTRHSPQSW